MNWTALWLNAAIFGLCLAVLYHIFVDTLRKRASFAMYAVRDDLVFLVASEVWSEDNEIFVYYYSRLNALLSGTPNVGVDNILEVVFAKWAKDEDFAEFLQQAQERTERLFQEEDFAKPEVRNVVSAYYRAVGNLILAYSSPARAIYLVLRHAAERARKRIVSKLPGAYRRALLAVDYTSREADLAATERR